MGNWSTLSSTVHVATEERFGDGKGGVKVGTMPASDTGSEEFILQGVQGVGNVDVEEGIRRTRTVTVVVDPRSRSRSKPRR
jgi:hypothetical protein